MTEKNYPEYRNHLQSLAAKLSKDLRGPVSGFAQLHGAAMADGALSGKVKELMALSVSVSVACQWCIAYHVHDALKAGATKEEIVEAIGVAVLMGGGPAMVPGCEALEGLEQFSGEG